MIAKSLLLVYCGELVLINGRLSADFWVSVPMCELDSSIQVPVASSGISTSAEILALV